MPKKSPQTLGRAGVGGVNVKTLQAKRDKRVITFFLFQCGHFHFPHKNLHVEIKLVNQGGKTCWRSRKKLIRGLKSADYQVNNNQPAASHKLACSNTNPS